MLFAPSLFDPHLTEAGPGQVFLLHGCLPGCAHASWVHSAPPSSPNLIRSGDLVQIFMKLNFPISTPCNTLFRTAAIFLNP